MMPSHTPGPWTPYDDSACRRARHEIVAFGKTVAHIYCTKGNEAEDCANARLIAAAPDLLDALRTIATMPVVEQDNVLSASMREIARSWVAAIEGATAI